MQQLRLKMIDRVGVKIGAVASFFGLCAQQVLGFWLALPWATQALLQGLITIAIFACTLVVGHFLRRFLNRNWPIDAPADGVTPLQVRIDLFDLFRRGVSRIKARRRPKESKV